MPDVNRFAVSPTLLPVRAALALSVFTLLGFALASIGAGGCASRGPAAAQLRGALQIAPARPLRVFAGIDTSVGARAHLAGYALVVSEAAEVLRPGLDTLTLYRVDRRTAEFSDRPAAGDAEATLAAIADEVRHPPAGPRTLPEGFWATVQKRAASGSEGNVVIVLASDGDNDNQSAASKRALRAAGSALARNPRVRAVVLCGVSSANRAYLRDCFAALDERRRLHILGPSEMEAGALAALIRASR